MMNTNSLHGLPHFASGNAVFAFYLVIPPRNHWKAQTSCLGTLVILYFHLKIQLYFWLCDSKLSSALSRHREEAKALGTEPHLPRCTVHAPGTQVQVMYK